MKNSVLFTSSSEPSVEVLRLSAEGIWANPDVPADEAAKLVLKAIDRRVKAFVHIKALEDFEAFVRADEREACARVCDEVAESRGDADECATEIRARGETK